MFVNGKIRLPCFLFNVIESLSLKCLGALGALGGLVGLGALGALGGLGGKDGLRKANFSKMILPFATHQITMPLRGW